MSFARQQRTFVVYTPAVAGQTAVATHHTMAGNGHRNQIGRAGTRHRAYSQWRPDLPGNLCIAGRTARRYAA